MSPKQATALLTAALQKLAKTKTAKGQKVHKIASLYAGHMPARELLLISAEDLEVHLQHVGEWILEAPGKAFKISVSNPAYTPHTVVEVHGPDQPFLIDTVWMQVQAHGCGIHHSFHPVFAVKRTAAGALQEIKPVSEKETGWQHEACMHVEIDRQSDPEARKKLEKALTVALRAAQHACQDFPKMSSILKQLADGAEESYPPAAQREENIAFMRWLLQDNFIFLGYRYYDVQQPKTKTAEPTVQAITKSGLGVLRGKSDTLSEPTAWNNVAPNIRTYLQAKSFLTVTKTLQKSPVHRWADMDYIGIREYDAEGRVTGEHRFVGLFTAKAYTTRAREIPIVGHKIRSVLAMEKQVPKNAYNYKSLQHILDTYPRDELFQINVKDLHRISTGILHLQERQQVRVFLNHTASERQVSVLVFLPLERMNSQQRYKIIDILMATLDGESIDYQVQMGDGVLARLFFKVRTRTHQKIRESEQAIEAKITAATLGWVDNLRHRLIEEEGEDGGLVLFNRYDKSFTLSYQECTPVGLAAQDIRVLEQMSQTDIDVVFTLYCEEETPRLRVFNRHRTISLSALMPLFDNMGFTVSSERPFKLHCRNGDVIWLHDFEMQPQDGLSCGDTPLVEALTLTWQGKLENDRLNGLIVRGGLNIQEVMILRLLVAYLRQVEHRYSWADVQRTLLKHPRIAKLLARLFETRFDPAVDRAKSQKTQTQVLQEITTELRAVQVLDEDRMLQKVQDVVLAIVRTNTWQRQSWEEPIAIKLDSSKVPNLVKPVPWREIFVYSPLVEGVHLRGGPVARGGLRWSDRAADFRTEVLGLMKAQMTKNAVIVPIGAKGGFYVKKLPVGDRAQVMAVVEQAYRQFVRALLSVTDNRIAGRVVHPQQVRCYDAEDPYFVVAADKGTATFSDTANEEAGQADFWELPKGVKKAPGFWLGDAFASGGSQGYDHKGMGITARGAWESVKNHFLALGKDIQQEDFTVVGIGDMAGDVFGNGMLLSPHIRLLGAFNHQHIFVDPNPDAAASFKERQRLFNAPHTTWADYDGKVLSKGARIFERSAKEVDLTPEIKKCFGLSRDKMTPNELIRVLLQADVDLLWNGGIGTYIKASHESHQDVADRTNDDLRINGMEVRAKVIGEGGNLGVTQLGRVEYALHGGHVNTDALDNAAGVNTSDHEVNIKILLAEIQQAGKLTMPKRNALLAEMTEGVAALVLESNYLQARAISLKENFGVKNIDTAWRLQQTLTQKGLLDPALEFLPDEETLENRKRESQGYTRPELCVLLAYAKADIYADLVASSLPDDPALADILPRYFPLQLGKYESFMGRHPLHREIIATVVTNELVDRMGLTFLNRLRDETGFSTAAVATAYLISSRLLEADRWWELVEMQDGKLPAAVQYDLYDIIKRTVEFGAFWFLRHASHPLRIEKALQKYQETFHAIYDLLEKTLSGHKEKRHHQRVEHWLEEGLRPELAHAFGLLSLMVVVPDIARLVHETRQPVPVVMQAYFMVGDRLKLARLHTLTRTIAVTNNWERVASLSIIDELYAYQSRVAALVLAQATGHKTADPQQLVTNWLHKRGEAVLQYDQRVTELLDQPAVSHAMMNVMLGQLKGLAS